jgi:hypothetical protein
MVTVSWLSWYVVNIYDFLVGIGVFQGIIIVITPPYVSIPYDRGATSISIMSFLSVSSLHKIAPYIAAPYATASSGLIYLLGSLPWK